MNSNFFRKYPIVENTSKSTFSSLSNTSRSLWAKTAGLENPYEYSPLYVHMGDSGEIVRLLWREWLPRSLKTEIINVTGSEEAAESLVDWLARVHDIGKATPGFQYKVPELAERVSEQGLVVPMKCQAPASHAFMSQMILERWLNARGWSYSNTYASVVGGHHGTPPNTSALQRMVDKNHAFPNEVMGDDKWLAVQDELLEEAEFISGVGEYQDHFACTPIPAQLQMLLTGLVIMADWLASNVNLFPLVKSISNEEACWQRACHAWSELELPGAWQADSGIDGIDAAAFLFHSRFPAISGDMELRKTQRLAVAAAFEAERPGLLIIEAPMGDGKTEAALLCAEVLAEKYGEGGVSYLLPTMATSNAMFSRVAEWLRHVPDRRRNVQQTIRLAHGKAELNEDYSRLQVWKSASMGDDISNQEIQSENVVVHQWLSGRKKSLLASFTVATVDQLLMAALKVRHVQLRHLGLAGKVVIVDEVHAYDAYMSVYLHRILAWLGAYDVPVILLSATLPTRRREELILAYRGTVDRKRTHDSVPHAPLLESGEYAYPLITYSDSDKKHQPDYHICQYEGKLTDITIEFMPDDDEILVDTLRDALSEGGCICVLRDTVKRAQHTYSVLKDSMPADIKLVHSRFVALDRMANDSELLHLLGPDGYNRPHTLIVVGTQVIEQSLDIDFDLIITDVAPIDLLLQRIGRVHRHIRGPEQCNRPPKLRQARCLITGVEDWTANPPNFAKGIAYIYQPAILLRTVAELLSRNNARDTMITLPTDIAALVESVYGDDKGIPELWAEKYKKAENKMLADREKQINRANGWLLGRVPRLKNDLTGLLDAPYTGDEDRQGRIAVRDSQESIEVVVVQGIGDEMYLLPWVINNNPHDTHDGSLGNGLSIPEDSVSRVAASCTVCLPPGLAHPGIAEQVVNALESVRSFSGWQESRWLKGQLPLVLDQNFEATIVCGVSVFRLRYSRELGLELLEEQEDD